MSSIKAEIVIVPTDKAANNMAFIRKHLYALAIIKELNSDCPLFNRSDDTYDFIIIKTKDTINTISCTFLNITLILLIISRLTCNLLDSKTSQKFN